MMTHSENTATLRTALAPYLAELWASRWLVTALAWILALVGWIVVMLLPDVYTVSARIYVDTETLLKPLMRGLTVEGDLDKQLAVMRRTLLSRPNIEQLLRATDLDLRANGPVQRESLIADLQNRIVVATAPTANQLYQITFTDSDPNMAQKVVRSLLNLLIEQNIGPQRRDVENARRFIDRQIAEYETRLREAEAKVAEFRRAHAEDLSAINASSTQLAEAEASQRRLEGELQSTQWRRDQIRLELARTTDTLETTASGPPPQSEGAADLSALRRKLLELRATHTDRSPDVVVLERQIAAFEAGAHGGPGGLAAQRTPNPTHVHLAEDLKRAELEVATLEWRSKAAAAEVASLRHRLDMAPEAQQQLTQLTRDYEVIRKNHEELTSRRETARMAQRLEDDSTNVAFRVIDPPVVPLAPTGPDRVPLCAGVLLASIAAAIGFVLLRHLTRDAFTGLFPLHDAFGLPVLGGVSRVRGPLESRMRVIEASVWLSSWIGLSALFGVLIHLQLTMPVHANLVGFTSGVADQLGSLGRLAGGLAQRLIPL